MRRVPANADYEGWVRLLGVSTHRQQAKRHLQLAGPPAVPALRHGLHHDKPLVRAICAAILDRLVDESSLPDLVAALDDDDPAVVKRALHALACDQCKENECRPGDELFVPRALELVERHPDPGIRASAIDALTRVAHRRPDALDALIAASERDPDSGLRDMARWRAQRVQRAAASSIR